jgi:hypothetical protein
MLQIPETKDISSTTVISLDCLYKHPNLKKEEENNPPGI